MNKFLQTGVLVLLVGTIGTSWAATKRKSTTTKTAAAPAAPAKSDSVARNPYLGAIAVDAADGRVIFEDNADARGYPASMLKLMTFLIVLEKIEQGAVKLSDPVTINDEVARIGGSQVYLKQGEVFRWKNCCTPWSCLRPTTQRPPSAARSGHLGCVCRVDEPARDGARHEQHDLPIRHGLPPGSGQKPDITTARDFARLCLELLKHKETLRYTATEFRLFRPKAEQPFEMRTHNHLLENYRGTKPHNFKGCDGLKTGFYRAAGYSMAVTAHNGDARVLVVVLDSLTADMRDTKARELMSKGLADIAAWRAKHPAAPAPVTPSPPLPRRDAGSGDTTTHDRRASDGAGSDRHERCDDRHHRALRRGRHPGRRALCDAPAAELTRFGAAGKTELRFPERWSYEFGLRRAAGLNRKTAMQSENIQRDVIEVDVLCVGAGVASLATA